VQEILEDVLTHTDLSVNEFFNYYFYGNSGLGKTFMCSCIAKQLLDSAYSVIYMTAYNLASLLEKNRFRYDNNEDTDEAVEMLFDADLLIIDDLGTESPNSVTASEIFNVINNRLIKRKSTVISSNLEPSELAMLYSDRVVSRIMGNYTLHHFYGSDIRMK
jgi:DNA replication protein DnaC